MSFLGAHFLHVDFLFLEEKKQRKEWQQSFSFKIFFYVTSDFETNRWGIPVFHTTILQFNPLWFYLETAKSAHALYMMLYIVHAS